VRFLIVGFSTRAIAESAVRSGAQVSTLDYFGDSDQRAIVENRSLLRDLGSPFSPQALLDASRNLAGDGLVYISSLENHPAIVEQLSSGRKLLGNPPETLRQVRDPETLRSFCCRAGLPFPATWLSGEEGKASGNGRWLRKPVRSGGGHDIEWWDGTPLDKDHLLQQYVEGTPASASFVANGSSSVLIGMSEQLIGQEGFGKKGFTWCGNILPVEVKPDQWQPLLQAVQTMADQLTQRFGLCGANGIDLVITHGPAGSLLPVLIEVNPRYTASMELVEMEYGLDVFSLHVRAAGGILPEVSLLHRGERSFAGKAIVFADRTAFMPDTRTWRARDRRDIPYPGEEVQCGHPICTVLARGPSRLDCLNGLLRAAGAVRQDVAGGTGGPA
jgi:hypothetical protein